MKTIPFQKNTVAITTLAMIAALGVVVRLTIRFVVIPDLVEITPAFIFSLLGGIIGGIPGGVFVGFIVGLSGALGGGEFPLIPLVGNILLGVGTGYAIHLNSNRDSKRYSLMAILGGGLIGGFISDMVILMAILELPLEASLPVSIVDMTMAFIWAFVAIVVERKLIRPIIGHYLYAEESEAIQELEE
ncbi:MAG: hypothetical protein ACTSUO_07780 [Candidatus Thorarchaeota archaeon]